MKDKHWLNVADAIAKPSKDPSKQVGAVIIRPNNTLAGTGYNGFCRGADDSPELYLDKDYKYAHIVHAEINAILFSREDLTDCTLYVSPLPPCNECAKAIIQSGIKKVVMRQAMSGDKWVAAWAISRAMFEECGVEWEMI